MNTTSQSPGNTTGANSNLPQDHLQNLQDDAHAALASAKEHGSAQFEQYRDTAVDQIESLAHSAQTAAEQMQESDTLGLSHYVTDLAQNMTTLAGNLRGKSIDELLQQAGKLARDNPALFVTGSVALGFGLSRFLRASAPDSGAVSSSQQASPNPPGTDEEFRPTQSSTIVEADYVAPTSHPHVGDVYHSGRPGIADRGTTPDAASGSFAPSDPSSGQADDDLSATNGQRKDDFSRGDVS
jgi:hypothetical protein